MKEVICSHLAACWLVGITQKSVGKIGQEGGRWPKNLFSVKLKHFLKSEIRRTCIPPPMISFFTTFTEHLIKYIFSAHPVFLFYLHSSFPFYLRASFPNFGINFMLFKYIKHFLFHLTFRLSLIYLAPYKCKLLNTSKGQFILKRLFQAPPQKIHSASLSSFI